ncbi:MAG: hypothetical protein DI566_07810 [Microbacterium sp.]|nr:MAG: hypothetical protein DI566_07810 [Microbacterium sp.]
MPNRIVVDLLGYTGRRGGTETYARELIPRLPGLIPDAEFVAITGRAAAAEVSDFFPGAVRRVPWVGADRVTWALAGVAKVNRLARVLDASMLWCPANFGPVVRTRVPRVVTVHDAIYHEADGPLLSRALSTATSWLMTRSAMTADRVITVSNAAANAIETHMRVSSERIVVVPNGSMKPSPPVDAAAIVSALGIPLSRPIVLSTGNRLPHKNFDALLSAIETIPSHSRPLTIITGSRDSDPLRAAIEQRGLVDDVRLVGWVTATELEALYAVAELYVCPSRVEGFGLPVVDALRRGVAVVANDIPVLREVGGNASIYVDAEDANAFGKAIARCVSTPQTQAERARARSWAEHFTWDSAAATTANVLASAIKGRG